MWLGCPAVGFDRLKVLVGALKMFFCKGEGMGDVLAFANDVDVVEICQEPVVRVKTPDGPHQESRVRFQMPWCRHKLPGGYPWPTPWLAVIVWRVVSESLRW